jgi:uncharacterized protein
MIWFALLSIGLGAGVASGMFGIGGGLLIVPALLLVLSFPPHMAMATSLVALLLPVGASAVYAYWSEGKIDQQHILYGLLIGAGLFIGAYFGARLAISLDAGILRKSFAIFLVFAAVLTWFKA